MKTLYFFDKYRNAILNVAPGEPEPNYQYKFELDDSASNYLPRYIVVDAQLVDKYPGFTDAQAAANEAFLATPPALAPFQIDNTITPIALKLRFTAQERVSIYASSDPIVIDFLKIIDDPRLQLVDKSLPATQEAFSYFVTLGLLTEERKLEILS